MKAASHKLSADFVWTTHAEVDFIPSEMQIAIAYGDKELLSNPDYLNEIKKKFSNAHILLGSTSGEIFQNEVNDHTISVSTVSFSSTPIKTFSKNINQFSSCENLGKSIFEELNQEDLRYIYILSDGGLINGSELIKGLSQNNEIIITGGMAGDADKFESTLVGLNTMPQAGNVVGFALYGNAIRIAHGSLGGWQEFGLSREITKSESNELYEVDDQNILDIYKRYLGKYAKELPGSALLFPLSIKTPTEEEGLVRTILSINNERKSLVFAGDMPEKARVRLMRSNPDNLVEAAQLAAKNAMEDLEELQPKLVWVVSCVGRKLVLRNRIAEEIEAVQNVVGDNVPISGFYSYGEFAPIQKKGLCKLHNQTLTLTLLDEIS